MFHVAYQWKKHVNVDIETIETIKSFIYFLSSIFNNLISMNIVQAVRMQKEKNSSKYKLRNRTVYFDSCRVEHS